MRLIKSCHQIGCQNESGGPKDPPLKVRFLVTRLGLAFFAISNRVADFVGTLCCACSFAQAWEAALIHFIRHSKVVVPLIGRLPCAGCLLFAPLLQGLEHFSDFLSFGGTKINQL
jgi:hypothetical protein